MRFCELKLKEVINEKSCKVLGNVCDLAFEEKNGCIKEIIVPGPPKYMGTFGRDTEYVIPYCNVCCIGEDIILVNIDEKECLKKCSTKDRFRDTFF